MKSIIKIVVILFNLLALNLLDAHSAISSLSDAQVGSLIANGSSYWQSLGKIVSVYKVNEGFAGCQKSIVYDVDHPYWYPQFTGVIYFYESPTPPDPNTDIAIPKYGTIKLFTTVNIVAATSKSSNFKELTQP